LKLYVAKNPPSDGDLRALAVAGKIDHRFAFTMITHNETERRRNDGEAHEIDRDNRQRYGERIEIETARRVAEWSNGHGPRSYEEFVREAGKLERSGSLGPSEYFASNYSRLDSAWKAGRSVVESNPEFTTYSSQLRALATNNGGYNLGGRGSNPTAVAQSLTRFHDLVMKDKKSPAEAFGIIAGELQKNAGLRSGRTGESLSEMAKRRASAGR
jgi:hypothetical protein